MRPFADIPGSENWKAVSAIDKGWSEDKKYKILQESGEELLLRLSPADRWERKKAEYEAVEALPEECVALLPKARGFGRCEAGVYTLLTFVPGEDAERVLPQLSPKQQYALGLNAGKALQQLHAIPAKEGILPWVQRFSAKMDRKIRGYLDCPIQFQGGQKLIGFLQDNRYLLKCRPQSFQHGDYHCGNMTVTKELQLGVLDFNRMDYGDPWEEFNRIVWCAGLCPSFAAGRVDGYFDGEVPESFFRLLLLYIGSNQLSSIPWAIPFGEKEVQTMLRQAGQVYEAYDGFTSVVPRWYKEGRKAAGKEA